MDSNYTANDVEIITTPDIPVALMEHRGSPKNVRSTIERFIAWRKSNGLRPSLHATYNIFHNDPQSTADDDYRICASRQTRVWTKRARALNRD